MAEKEYIERGAVIVFLENMAASRYLIQCFTDNEKFPAADVVEVRHAAKVDSAISKTGLMCTACHSDVDRDAVWCKYCGAKMDGKGDA